MTRRPFPFTNHTLSFYEGKPLQEKDWCEVVDYWSLYKQSITKIIEIRDVRVYIRFVITLSSLD